MPGHVLSIEGLGVSLASGFIAAHANPAKLSIAFGLIVPLACLDSNTLARAAPCLWPRIVWCWLLRWGKEAEARTVLKMLTYERWLLLAVNRAVHEAFG